MMNARSLHFDSTALCPGPATIEGLLRHHRANARQRLLDFLRTLPPEEFTQPLPAFQGHSIRDLLVHAIETEHFWISVLAREPRPPFEGGAIHDIASAIHAWEGVSDRTFDLLRSADLEEFVNTGAFETREGEPPEALVPSLVVVHVLTHEFHHKGQICAAARILGHEPPDLDFI